MKEQSRPPAEQARQFDRRTMLRGMLAVAGGLAVASCAPKGSESERRPEGPDLTDPAKRLRAERVISTFENSTTDIKYYYAKRLDDGRGLTAGRSGFTSGTGDLLMVVQRYEGKAAGSETQLTRYVPALQSVNGSGDLTGLNGFESAWANTSRTDPNLNATQDEVYSELYFNPALGHAREQGVRTAAGQLILLDSIVQHGNGTADSDPDGLPAMLRQHTDSYGGLQAGDEAGWLRGFMDVRRDHLVNPVNTATQTEWSQSVGRVDSLESFIDRDMMDLEAPLDWQAFGSYYRLED